MLERPNRNRLSRRQLLAAAGLAGLAPSSWAQSSLTHAFANGDEIQIDQYVR